MRLSEVRLIRWREFVGGRYYNSQFACDVIELLDTVAILRAELAAVEIGSDEDHFQ